MKLNLVLWKGKVDRPLARFIRKITERGKTNIIRNEKSDLTTDTIEIKGLEETITNSYMTIKTT